MIKCLVPVSGGKDSQACLKMALEHFPAEQILGLFCDTQYEHPTTYAHVAWMAEYYGVKIHTVCAGDVLSKSRKYGRFPGGGARHCTDELKITPTKIFCRDLAIEQGSALQHKRNKVEASTAGGFEVWYGMRHQESAERAARYDGKLPDQLYAPHEVMPSKYPQYLAALGVQFRLCVLDWSDREVIDYCGWEKLNPLYHAGFPRVGCFPCLASGDKWKAKAFKYDDFGQFQLIRTRQVSSEIGKPVFTSKGHAHMNDNNQEGPGCLICSY